MKRLLLAVLAVSTIACNQPKIPQEIALLEDKLPEQVDYNLHIKPILSDRCFKCHGPDKTKVAAGLQLTSAEGAYAKLKSGKRAIVAGNIAESELVKRILSHDPEEMMPSIKSNLSLTNEEKALLIKWIQQGAVYKELWSLTKLEKPEIPEIGSFWSRVGLAKNWENEWAKNEIDNFALQKLKKEKLKPSPEAAKATLLRRVSMDLTGLPPTVEEVDAYLNDKSPNAYEKLVDKLLTSPHYGEQMAVDWLDVARYADSHGYQLDVMRNASPYRDWVIHSFNQNLSYDKFITWQLAGDLLPQPTREQLIATAFNRMHAQNQEGGIVEEEYLVEYAADRTNTFGKAFLGLTVECARCHDHKYDPISQKDYYSLFAFFNNINEAGQVPYNGESSPTLILTTEEADKQLQFINHQLTPLPPIKPTLPADERWLTILRQNPQLLTFPKGLIGSYSFEDTDLKTFKNEANLKQNAIVSGDLDNLPKIIAGKLGQGRYVNGEGNIDLGKKFAFFEHSQPFSIALWVNLQKKGIRGPIFSRANGLDNGNRGYECMLNKDGTINFYLAHSYPDNAIDLHTIQPLPVNQWVHLAFVYDGLGTAAGTKIYINGHLTPVQVWADNLKRSILLGANNTNGFGLEKTDFAIGAKFRDSMRDFEVDELKVYDRLITPIELMELNGRPNLIKTLVEKPTLNSAEKQLLYEFYWTAFDKEVNKKRQEQITFRQQKINIYQQQKEIMIMKERHFPRQSYLLKRGVYDAHGDKVSPATPTRLTDFSKFPKNRLGLAQWLLSADNQLFPRVIVNRFWQQFFGNGLVKTSEDFGNQGNMPSHPELLDWLAVTFREENWDVKKFVKRIVLSATYRQSSATTNKLVEKDPDNQLLARGPSYRLSAEQVRDNALAASGLLVRKIGGKSVYPYQPAGIWESVSSASYRQEHGDSLYRRSMYTIWKRTVPPPMMLNFDAPDRGLCIVRRQKTSTPLQALVTLNDPQFVEAARALAEAAIIRSQKLGFRIQHSGIRNKVPGIRNKEIDKKAIITKNPYSLFLIPDALQLNPESSIIYAFKAVISRPPRLRELSLMKKLYQEELADFEKNPEKAKELLTVGEKMSENIPNNKELSAMTVVCSTLMNYDEALIKR